MVGSIVFDANVVKVDINIDMGLESYNVHRTTFALYLYEDPP